MTTAKEIADALGTTPEKLAAVLAGGEKLIALLGEDMPAIIQEGKWSRARKDIATQLAYVNQRSAVLRAEHEQQINDARQKYLVPLEQSKQVTEGLISQETARLQALASAIESGDLQPIPSDKEIDKRLAGG